MFDKIDRLDRSIRPWTASFLTLVVLIFGLILLVRSVRRHGIQKNVWQMTLYAAILGLAVFRCLPFTVDLRSNTENDALPKVTACSRGVLPILPDNELTGEKLDILGDILSEAKIVREFLPSEGGDADYEASRLRVLIRDHWSSGNAMKRTIVSYELNLYVPAGRDEKTNPAKTKGSLVCIFGDGESCRLKLLDADAVISQMEQRGLLDERDPFVDSDMLVKLEREAGYEQYQVNQSGETFGSVAAAFHMFHEQIDTAACEGVSYEKFMESEALLEIEEHGFYCPDLIAVNADILQENYTNSSGSGEWSVSEEIFGYIKRSSLSRDEDVYQIYSNDGKTLLGEAQRISFFVDYAALEKEWGKEQIETYEERLKTEEERICRAGELQVSLDETVRENGEYPSWYGGSYVNGESGVTVWIRRDEPGTDEGIERLLAVSEEVRFQMNARFSYGELLRMSRQLWDIARGVQDNAFHYDGGYTYGVSAEKNRIVVALTKDTSEQREAFLQEFSRIGDPDMIVFEEEP